MLSAQQIQQFQRDGYLIIHDAVNLQWQQKLLNRAKVIVKNFEPGSTRNIFTTYQQTKYANHYFLTSGDKVRCFYEEHAINPGGQLLVEQEKAINKIGHALHSKDPVYKEFVHWFPFLKCAEKLGLTEPEIIQSMVIFKQPGIGGEVNLHQDSSFLYTEPESCLGFWFALEDATIENGCLQVMPQGHQLPLKKRFVRQSDDNATFITIDSTPFPDVELKPIEVKAGTLVILHGRLPHASRANQSQHSRIATTFHVVDHQAVYPENNWLAH